MAEVKERITLSNEDDRALARRGYIKESEIRKVNVEAVIDTGATHLVIPESLRAQLGLGIKKVDSVVLAADVHVPSVIAEGVLIELGDRYVLANPVVLSSGDEVLLGVYPLEEMDLMVDPVRQRVTGAHGKTWMRYIR